MMTNENEAPEHGICKFKTVHIVTTYTSGNELRGTPVRFGEYDSAMVARQALADDGFTNGQFGWRKGYSDATIEKVVKHYDYRADLSDAKDATIAKLEASLKDADRSAELLRVTRDDWREMYLETLAELKETDQ